MKAPTSPPPLGRADEDATFSLAFTHGPPVSVDDEAFSDRLWCDVPLGIDAPALAAALVGEARLRGRGRVVAVAPIHARSAFVRAGFVVEGIIPGYYGGRIGAAVMGWFVTPARGQLARPAEVRRVLEILSAKAGTRGRSAGTFDPEIATASDAGDIAGLVGETFSQYPCSTDDPASVATSIDEGKPFAVVRDGDRIVACAGADIVAGARAAELTDCATHVSHRGRGLMQAILRALMRRLARQGYPTAFSLARATVPGVNLAFQRLGFTLRGTMPRSCRIGSSVEDMHIWSRRLDVPTRLLRPGKRPQRAPAPRAARRGRQEIGAPGVAEP